jgi:RHS repeat-associated protein
VINDGTFGYQWDAEGKLTAITLSGNTIATNVYNALGRNVRHVGSGETTDEVYGADGFLLWRYTGNTSDPKQRAFVPFEGGILAEYYGGSPGGTLFDHPDELGSLSTAIDYAASHSAERLFYPFGEMWTGSDLYSLGMHQEFAKLPDYDNDANSDLYNTLNRHYTPMGRWLSPDPGGVKVVKLDDPQTWNMYAYVRNNPTTLSDPTGLEDDSCGPCVAFGGDDSLAAKRLKDAKSKIGAKDENQPPTQNKSQTQQDQQQPASASTPRTPRQGPPDTTVHYPGDKPGTGTDRTYGPDGDAVKDIDSGHDHGAGDPHAHDWDHSGDKPKRGPGRPLTPEEKDKIKGTVKKVAPVVVAGAVVGAVVQVIIETAPYLLPALAF